MVLPHYIDDLIDENQICGFVNETIEKIDISFI